MNFIFHFLTLSFHIYLLLTQVLNSYLERVLVDLEQQNNGTKNLTGKNNGRDFIEEEDDNPISSQILSSSSSFTASFANTFSSKNLASSSEVTYGNNNSGHGALVLSLNSSHGMGEESFTTLVAGLMSTPDCIRVKGNDVKLFYALNEKIIAAESCFFAALVSTYVLLKFDR